ncbi:MAG: succinylglutamate desuccinylase/aspartoacylase family protein [Armatimonadota bacterium]|nr:succinylglutamate desuccinylase/aspartoacylase family protein [Armatimonadota bacterium]
MAAGRSFSRIPVTVELHGGEIAIPVHEVIGARDGPTLTVLAMLHGSEWLEIDVIKRLLQRLDPRAMAGRVLAVPVANPVAFGMLTRNIPLDESDAPDLNRNFPGSRKSASDLLAKAIVERLLASSQYLIDLHHGIWGSTWYTIVYPIDLPDPAVNRAAALMAHTFGHPILHPQAMAEPPGKRSAAWYAGTHLGVAPIIVEIGGAGFDRALEEAWIEANVTGMLSVMRALRMLDGEPTVLDRYLHYRKYIGMQPAVAGYLVPEIGPEMLGKESPAGTVAGRVISPYTLGEVEVLATPVRCVWANVARAYPVRPGSWAYGVIDLDDPDTSYGPATVTP